MGHRAPRVFTIPSGAPFLPTLSRALLDGALIDGFPGAGGPMALADATIYVPTQRAAQALAQGAARGERRAEPAPAAHRAARRLRAGRDGDGLRPRGRGRPAGGDPRGGRRAHAPPCARHPHPRLGKGAQGRDPTGGRGRAPHFRRRRARAGRGDPRAGLRARGRSRGADRRYDHRGRAMDEARNARARSL